MWRNFDNQIHFTHPLTRNINRICSEISLHYLEFLLENHHLFFYFFFRAAKAYPRFPTEDCVPITAWPSDPNQLPAPFKPVQNYEGEGDDEDYDEIQIVKTVDVDGLLLSKSVFVPKAHSTEENGEGYNEDIEENLVVEDTAKGEDEDCGAFFELSPPEFTSKQSDVIQKESRGEEGSNDFNFQHGGFNFSIDQKKLSKVVEEWDVETFIYVLAYALVICC